jgi:mono/diheme cytochrome c family protein
MSRAIPSPQSTFVAVAILAASLITSGCRPNLPPSKPLSELTPQEASGHAVFQSHCARCHHANSQDGFKGPGLQGLYKVKYLPSGAPANDDRVTSAILHGRGMMPSFASDLDSQQMNDLIAYLHTL